MVNRTKEGKCFKIDKKLFLLNRRLADFQGFATANNSYYLMRAKEKKTRMPPSRTWFY